MMEIYVDLNLTEGQQARLRGLAGEAVLHLPQKPDVETFRRCEVVFGNPPAEWLSGSDRLRWVQLESVGFGEYTGLDWQRLGLRLTLTNLAGFFADPVAQTALAGILALYRGIERLIGLQQSRTWLGEELRPGLRTLRGDDVVLFGFGAINRRLAELLAPFGCSIVSFGREWSAGALDGALTEAAVVVSAVPDTPETRGVFDRARLARLRREAVFVSVGRGSVVDEAALADALSAGALGGAVIDVTQHEPLPPENPLWRCPNTIITQHSGGGSSDEIDRKIDVFARNLSRYRKGEALDGAVDFSRGY